MRWYVLRRKLLHKMKDIAMCHHVIDELTVVKYQVDETQLLIEYIVPYVIV